MRDLNIRWQMLIVKNDAESTELKTKATLYQSRIENLLKERDQIETQVAEKRQQYEAQLVKEKEN